MLNIISHRPARQCLHTGPHSTAFASREDTVDVLTPLFEGWLNVWRSWRCHSDFLPWLQQLEGVLVKSVLCCRHIKQFEQNMLRHRQPVSDPTPDSRFDTLRVPRDPYAFYETIMLGWESCSHFSSYCVLIMMWYRHILRKKIGHS